MRKTAIIYLILLLLSHISLAQEAIEFHFDPQIGETLHVNMFMDTDTEGAQNMIMETNMSMEITPIKKEGEVFTVESLVKNMKINMQMGMQNISYDSGKEAEDEASQMLADQFSKIIDKKIVSLITERGETKDVQLPESLKVQGFDSQTFSNNITAAYPAHPVKPGDSWESTAEFLENPALSETKLTSTYRQETDEGYIIDVEGELLGSSGDSLGTVEGYYILDKKSHFTKESVLTNTMEIQGMEVRNKITVTVE